MASAPVSIETTQATGIVDALRSLIIRGTLAPGEHLGQSDLASRFKISKVPTREALRQLAAEGLLQHDPNRGYFVARLSIGEASQLYRVRRWVESELLASARWPSAEEIAAFRCGFEAVDRLGRSDEHGAWIAALEALRRSIFELSPQKVLLREASRLWSLTDRYRAVLPHATEDSAEHLLIDALEQQDRSALLAIYHANRDRIEQHLFEVLEPA